MDLSKHSQFEAGNVHTDFITQHSEELFPNRVLSSASICQAAVALVLKDRETAKLTYQNTLGSLLRLFHYKMCLKTGKFLKNRNF